MRSEGVKTGSQGTDDEQVKTEDDKQVETEFVELHDHADCYQQLNNPDSPLAVRMRFYDEFKVGDQLEAFMLYMVTKIGLSESTRIQLFFDVLESWLVRNMLCTPHANSGYTGTFLSELNSTFRSIIDGKIRLNMEAPEVGLIQVLATNWPTDGKVVKYLNGLPTKKSRRTRSSQLSVVKYIFNHSEIEWGIGDADLYKRFCGIWKSHEEILSHALPYEKWNTYQVILPSKTHKFMTDDGIEELSEYTINGDIVSGKSCNGEVKQLKRSNILFSFLAEAEPELRCHISQIDGEVKKHPQKPSQIDNFLAAYKGTRILGGRSKSDKESPAIPLVTHTRDAPVITAVTHTGHALHGTLIAFNDDEIYMRINAQTVTVYKRALYGIYRTIELALQYCKKNDETQPPIADDIQVETEFVTNFDELCDYANCYQKLYNPNSPIRRRMRFYDEFKVGDQLELFVLYIMKKIGPSGISSILKVFDILESWVLRNMLHSRQSRHDKETICPLSKLNSLFRLMIDGEIQIDLADPVAGLRQFLSRSCPTNEEVNKSLNNLPRSEGTRRKSEYWLKPPSAVRYIFSHSGIGWDIKHDDLCRRFFEIWKDLTLSGTDNGCDSKPPTIDLS